MRGGVKGNPTDCAVPIEVSWFNVSIEVSPLVTSRSTMIPQRGGPAQGRGAAGLLHSRPSILYLRQPATGMTPPVPERSQTPGSPALSGTQCVTRGLLTNSGA